MNNLPFCLLFTFLKLCSYINRYKIHAILLNDTVRAEAFLIMMYNYYTTYKIKKKKEKLTTTIKGKTTRIADEAK